MEEDQNKVNWKSVPAFGEWEMMQGLPDYSLDFSKIREMKRQSKHDFSRISVGNEQELIPKRQSPPVQDDHAKPQQQQQQQQQPQQQQQQQRQRQQQQQPAGRQEHNAYANPTNDPTTPTTPTTLSKRKKTWNCFNCCMR